MITLLKNRYRIIKQLGSGGFGETFLAEDTDLPSRRYCVIKQLKPIVNDPQIYQLVQQRFQREAVILEKLGEGNSYIPSLYAYFEQDGQFYLVQEWIDGLTLTEKIQQVGVLSEKTVKDILFHCLSVLVNVHNQHIIHRDIKPDNILLRKTDNQPVLIDFGAVKEAINTVIVPSNNQTSSIIIGTPGFMPSEQSIGRPVFSSDLYSLALTAIYLLTSKTPSELEIDLTTGNFCWRQYNPSLSSQFASILDKAIQSHPRDRFLTATDMLKALQSLTNNYGTTKVQSNSVTSTVPIQAQQGTISTLEDWRKFLIIGSIIGVFSLVAIILIGIFVKLQTQKTATSPTPTPTPITQDTAAIQTRISAQINKPSPKQVVLNYYEFINGGDYRQAWDMLPIDLQENKKIHPDGYYSFENWFKKISPININNIRVVEESPSQASVDLFYSAFLNGKSLSMTLRYKLVWNSSTQQWMIKSVRKIN